MQPMQVPVTLTCLNRAEKFGPICDTCLDFEVEFHIQRDLLQKNTHKRLVGQQWTLQPSFATLETNADAGCVKCKFFRHCLTQFCYAPGDLPRLRSVNPPVVVETFQRVSGEEGGFASTLSCDNVQAPIVVVKGDAPSGYSEGVASCEESGIATIKQCMETCARTHLCSAVLGSPIPPKRLLSVKENSVSLITVSNMDVHPRYVALSYCWGGYEGLRLQNSNLQQLEAGIRYPDLPKTIRDAAILSLRLEIPYLWVDALCITQNDDGVEWKQEAERMHEIYGNAAFTLAASSSTNTDSGFLDRSTANTLKGPILDGFAGNWIALGNCKFSAVRAHSPLSVRGWTFQEELMSPRMVYWSDRGVFWYCMGDKRCNIHADMTINTFNPQMFWTYQFPLELWAGMVEDFSKRAFTVPGDRLPALAGLVNIIRRKVRDDCIQGHWKSQLPNSLLWVVLSAQERQPVGSLASKGLAPSWSWASVPPPCPIRVAKVQTNILAEMLHNEDEREGNCVCIRGRAKILPAGMKEIAWPRTADGRFVEKIETVELEAHSPCYAFKPGQMLLCRDGRTPVTVQLDYEGSVDPRYLICLQIAEDGFLLLANGSAKVLDYRGSNSLSASLPYRRVGCALACEDKHFFDSTVRRGVTIA